MTWEWPPFLRPCAEPVCTSCADPACSGTLSARRAGVGPRTMAGTFWRSPPTRRLQCWDKFLEDLAHVFRHPSSRNHCCVVPGHQRTPELRRVDQGRKAAEQAGRLAAHRRQRSMCAPMFRMLLQTAQRSVWGAMPQDTAVNAIISIFDIDFLQTSPGRRPRLHDRTATTLKVPRPTPLADSNECFS